MTPEHDILQVTPRVEALAALCRSNSRIDPALYRKYDVKRGLRDINGQGVLAGLTNISDIISQGRYGEIVPCEGELYYRGIRIQDLVQGLCSGRPQGLRGSCVPAPVRRAAGCKAAGRLQRRCWHRAARCRPISPAMSS